LPLNLIPFDYSAAMEAAAIRAQLERKGMLIGPYDLLIAGLARSLGLKLVTNNIKEFERIVDLSLENWVE
jgi:tRNA(fMet)-specific endonuclease VapC